MSYYAEKTAVVTGAATGFGLAIAERLLSLGAAGVWMGDFNETKLIREAERLNRRYPGKAHAVRCNCMVTQDVYALIAAAAAEGGRLDFVFNNAGRPMTRPIGYIKPEEFEDLVKLNYLGVVHGTMAALPITEKQGSGHIVNTASCGGLIPAAYQSAYASTKAAVITFTRCLAYEYDNTAIRFSQISPMNVATDIFKAETINKLREAGKSEEEIERATAGIRPPAGTMPLDEAIDYIFDKLEQGDVDIIFGEDGREYYRLFCEDRPAFNAKIKPMTEARRAFYEAIKRGEEAVFPG